MTLKVGEPAVPGDEQPFGSVHCTTDLTATHAFRQSISLNQMDLQDTPATFADCRPVISAAACVEFSADNYRSRSA